MATLTLGAVLGSPADVRAQGFFSRLFSCCGLAPDAPATFAQANYAPQTCRYVPQTCYRTVYQTVPVTTYRPVTTYCRKAALVPYTTYRLVSYRACDPCARCGTSGGYGIATSASGCSSCGGGVTVTGPSNGGATPSPATPPPSTFENGTPGPEPRIDPTPKPINTPAGSTTIGPSLMPPVVGPQDRITARPIHQASYAGVVPEEKPKPVYGVWRAARPRD